MSTAWALSTTLLSVETEVSMLLGEAACSLPDLMLQEFVVPLLDALLGEVLEEQQHAGGGGGAADAAPSLSFSQEASLIMRMHLLSDQVMQVLVPHSHAAGTSHQHMYSLTGTRA